MGNSFFQEDATLSLVQDNSQYKYPKNPVLLGERVATIQANPAYCVTSYCCNKATQLDLIPTALGGTKS